MFDFVAAHHFENHPIPDVLEMNQTSPGTVASAQKANIVRRQGSRRVEGTATVTEYQPDQSAAWDVQFGHFLSRQRVELAPDQGGAATRLRLSIDSLAAHLVGGGSCQAMAEGVLGPPVAAGRLDLLSLTVSRRWVALAPTLTVCDLLIMIMGQLASFGLP